MKRKPALHTQKKQNDSWGFVGVLLLLIVVAFGFLLAGGLTFEKSVSNTTGGVPVGSSYACCDLGDGDQCKPQTGSGQTFTFQATGTEYGLLKSEITFSEPIYHLKDTGETFNGNPIILNTADGYGATSGECGQGQNDQVWGTNGCVPIPNDEIIYVCKKNCVSNPSDPGGYCGSPSQLNLSCYGQADTVYDVYFKLADYPTPGVPDVIKNCDKSSPRRLQKPIEFNRRQVIVAPPEVERENLQLSTFKVIQSVQNSVPWLSPYCKPAIYLYPEKASLVNVKIDSSTPLTYTDPAYPINGWTVLAESNGNIFSENKYYDYLYYETEVLDSNIQRPEEGFIVERKNIKSFLSSLLPKVGLNLKETIQFSDYWDNALPISPYYFIGIITRENLDSITSLAITPKPKTVIRVTLYFEVLDKTIDINEPKISFPKRDGFTVVEWGGIYKKHKNEAFSCFL